MIILFFIFSLRISVIIVFFPAVRSCHQPSHAGHVAPVPTDMIRGRSIILKNQTTLRTGTPQRSCKTHAIQFIKPFSEMKVL
jgi:hypothetical protein